MPSEFSAHLAIILLGLQYFSTAHPSLNSHNAIEQCPGKHQFITQLCHAHGAMLQWLEPAAYALLMGRILSSATMSLYMPCESHPRSTTWANSPRTSLIRACNQAKGSSSEVCESTCKDSSGYSKELNSRLTQLWCQCIPRSEFKHFAFRWTCRTWDHGAAYYHTFIRHFIITITFWCRCSGFAVFFPFSRAAHTTLGGMHETDLNSHWRIKITSHRTWHCLTGCPSMKKSQRGHQCTKSLR